MNRVLLCEGVTDAILLSYYLEKVSGWKYCKGPKNLEIKTKNRNESVNWYRKGEEYLLICGVGGKNNFAKFFETRIKNPIFMSDAFQKIVFVTDRDERADSEIINELYTEDMLKNLEDRRWRNNIYRNAYEMEKMLEVLLVVIPKESQGALETVMLEAIAEDPYDRNIIEKVDDFMQQMSKEAEKYLSTERLQLKAKLGVTWAVQFPEKVFSRIDEQIRNVEWEKSELLKRIFRELEEI